jgi:hypothetical protein
MNGTGSPELVLRYVLDLKRLGWSPEMGTSECVPLAREVLVSARVRAQILYADVLAGK